MKVLMLGFEFPPLVSGGLGTACEGLARALGTNEVDVLFVTPHASESSRQASVEVLAADSVELPPETRALPLAPRLEQARVESALTPYLDEREYRRRLDALRRQATDVPPEERLFSSAERARTYGDDLHGEVRRYARAVAEIVRDREIDVIHAHDWMSFPAGILAKELSGKPLVCHVHSCEHDRRPQVRSSDPAPDPRILEIERAGLQAADRVVCVSRRAADELVTQHAVPFAKLRVVHNAVEPVAEDAVPANVERNTSGTVLFLGRVTHQKGPEYFLEAARLVLNEAPEVRFVISGTGELLPDMIERARQLEIADQVEFTGFLEGEAREEAFAAADVFVMPSVSEPFGITPLEAMVRGVPVIVSKQSGVREVTKSVLEVDYWDVQGLAERILDVLRRPALREQLVEQGRADAKRLRWDGPARRLVGIYEEVVA